MVLSARGRGKGRSTGQAPRQVNNGRGLPSEPTTWTLRDERQSSSDDSTQSPDFVGETFLGPCNEAEMNTTGQGEEPTTSKRRRGVAKGTEFERLRKLGKIPLDIKDGRIGPSCNNRTIYTTRVTWIIKHYAEMRHISWKVVDVKEKDELIERVRADFLLDWTKKNHRQTVTNQLCHAYNAFHYLLHLKYKEYATHEDALANGGSLVEKPIWEWLCNRWVSAPFKKMSEQNRDNRRKQKVNHTSGRTSFVVLMEQKKEKNLISFYKDVHWSTKKGRFITPTTEENYNEMVAMMDAKEPENRTNDAAAAIFREVLGHRSGYSRGLGHSVIPESSKVSGIPNEEYERLVGENEQNKKNAEYFQNRFEEIQNGFMAMRDHMEDYEQRLNLRLSGIGSELESQREIQGDP